MLQLRLFILVFILVTIGSGLDLSVAQTNNNAIKIGLLIHEPKAPGAKHGAELAIREANVKGGYRGRPFQLVLRSTDGPWGAGSKESVAMVFDDDVVAIIGSLDGRNAHLAEQVAAKTRILFLSAWATDMTLSQAYVPWYFRCNPNDHQQAVSLIREIFEKRKITRVVVIGTEDYDSRNAVQILVKAAASMNISIAKQFVYRSSVPDFQKEMMEIFRSDMEAVVLIGKPSLASDIIPLMKHQNRNLPVFGSLSMTNNLGASDPLWDLLEGMVLVSSGHWFTEKGKAFQKDFQSAYGYQPGVAAAYAYDAMGLMIEVLKSSGPDRDQIVDAFPAMDYRNGVTGEIRFDADGNRVGLPKLMTVKNGIPVLIKTEE